MRRYCYEKEDSKRKRRDYEISIEIKRKVRELIIVNRNCAD